MGIVIPRPTMRSKERRKVTATLSMHYELMKKFEAEGMSRDEASRKAFDEIKEGR